MTSSSVEDPAELKPNVAPSMVRPGGLILLDNVLWFGAVLNPDDTSENTVAIRAVNDFVAGDERVEAVMLAVADGLTLARKR